jgi:hypothetical protein
VDWQCRSDISVGVGNSSITLGTATSLANSNSITVASGGIVSLAGNDNTIDLGVTGNANNTLYGTTTVTVAGAGNSIVAQPSFGDTLSDSTGSTGTTFSLTDPLGGSVLMNGSSDLALITGGNIGVSDLGQGNVFDIASDANVLIKDFTSDKTSLIDLLPNEGYATVAKLLAAVVSDGDGGSYIPLGSAGSGIDFLGVTPSEFASFAAAGTHIAIVTQF